MSNKKYGLILPGPAKIQKPTFQASRNVFGDDSDSDDESKKKPVLLRPSQNIKRQAKISQEKALTEDPTVYQYDEIYDSMSSQKEEKKKKTKEEKKPRYIENLLKTASKRKIENEHRIERQIQKEREKEGDEFADKEVFVTSAYKKKLEEMKIEEEKEKREEYLESVGDVTKQRDLGGFYRHLYEQKLGSENKAVMKNEESDGETIKDNDGSKTPEKVDTFKQHSNKSDSNKKDKTDTSKKRNYRKRKSSEAKKDLSEGEIDDSDDEINHVNLTDIREAKRSKGDVENIDADSDFSIDDSSDEESNPDLVCKKTSTESPQKTDADTHKKHDMPEKSPLKDHNKIKTSDKSTEKVVEITPPKPKIDIWKKRTVGEVFEQALKRYYERKASRGF